MEYLARFLIGGLVVSGFAILGDVLRPKSFAGLFGAAPSVALATLALALFREGGAYAAVQAHAMVLGSIALCVYSILVCQLLMRWHWHALRATVVALAVWLAVALGLHVVTGIAA